MKLLSVLLLCSLSLGIVSALTAKERRIASFAVSELGPGYSLVKVKSVQKQVVRGIMYHVKAKVRYQLLGGIEQVNQCYLKVWVRPSGYKTLEEFSCK